MIRGRQEQEQDQFVESFGKRAKIEEESVQYTLACIPNELWRIILSFMYTIESNASKHVCYWNGIIKEKIKTIVSLSLVCRDIFLKDAIDEYLNSVAFVFQKPMKPVPVSQRIKTLHLRSGYLDPVKIYPNITYLVVESLEFQPWMIKSCPKIEHLIIVADHSPLWTMTDYSPIKNLKGLCVSTFKTHGSTLEHFKSLKRISVEKFYIENAGKIEKIEKTPVFPVLEDARVDMFSGHVSELGVFRHASSMYLHGTFQGYAILTFLDIIFENLKNLKLFGNQNFSNISVSLTSFPWLARNLEKLTLSKISLRMPKIDELSRPSLSTRSFVGFPSLKKLRIKQEPEFNGWSLQLKEPLEFDFDLLGYMPKLEKLTLKNVSINRQTTDEIGKIMAMYPNITISLVWCKVNGVLYTPITFKSDEFSLLNLIPSDLEEEEIYL